MCRPWTKARLRNFRSALIISGAGEQQLKELSVQMVLYSPHHCSTSALAFLSEWKLSRPKTYFLSIPLKLPFYPFFHGLPAR